jgi:hypothetical protein
MPSRSFQQREDWRAYVDALVDGAPPLTAVQRDRLAVLLQSQPMEPENSKPKKPKTKTSAA